MKSLKRSCIITMQLLFFDKNLAISTESTTFAPDLRMKWHLCPSRGVAQLVAFLVWDQAVARSSRVAPTNRKAN